MNGLALLGILLLIYAVAVVAITVQKPDKIWAMPKIRLFVRLLGETGTTVFFYVFAAAAAAAGVWLLML